jgi:hypothetical protein
MLIGSLTRTWIVALAGALALAACASSPETPGGTAGSGAGTAGTTGTAGTSATGMGGSMTGCVLGPQTGAPGFGAPTQGGSGTSTAKYFGTDVTRNGDTYRFITNWWGSGWVGSTMTYNGASFSASNTMGTSMPDGTPIGYPTTYCGRYSENNGFGNCGLPAAYSTIDKLWTGWKWSATGSGGQFNAAWDIWLGTASTFQSYLMVWLRDPPSRVPAGNAGINAITVPGVPGVWNIRYGTVNGRPIVNYVRSEGQDACEFEFNIMDFISDAQARAATTSGLTLPGDTVRAVAAGFEFWTGPFSNVTSEDFYVKLVTR